MINEKEKIAKIIAAYAPIQFDCNKIAESLVKAGIGDKEQAVKEAFDRLMSSLSKTKPFNYEFMQSMLKHIFTELYGVEE